MPKRAELDVNKEVAGLMESTEPKPKRKPKSADPVKSAGISLKTSEWSRLDEIARELGVKRHTLTMFVMRDFIKRYDAGERPETEQKTVLKLS